MDTMVVEKSFGLKLKTNFQNFIYSFYYPLAVAFFTVFIYFTEMQLAGLFAFALLAMFILICQKDLTPILPLLFNVIFLFSDISVFENPLSFVLFAPALIGFIVHFIKYPFKKVKFGLYGVSLFAIFVSLLLGGVLTKEYISYFDISKSWFGEGASLIFGVGLGLIAEYFILKNGISVGERKGFDLKIYFSYTMLFAALAVGMQLLLMRALDMPRDFGWGNINFCGYVFLLAVPSAFYLLIKTKHVFTYFMIILVLYAITYISHSDGALGTMLLFLPVMLVYSYVKLQKTKKLFFLNVCSLLLIALIICVIIGISIDDYFIYYVTKHFFNDTGRSPLFTKAIEIFKNNPIFGVGVFHTIRYTSLGSELLRNYHSSIFNTLATTGLVGMFALLFNYFARFKILMNNKSIFNACTYFSIAMYIAYSSIDHGEVTMLLILVTAILVVVEKLNGNKKQSYKKLLEEI